MNLVSDYVVGGRARNAVYTNEDDEPVGTLQAFSISLEGGKNEPPPSGDAFVCKNFTLSAPKQTLFDNAEITVTQGHRYGILGPNGQVGASHLEQSLSKALAKLTQSLSKA